MEDKQTSLQKLMGVINKIGSAIMLNLLFLVSCIPVVTIGPACSGLYSAVRYSIRGDSSFSGFAAGFKTRFLRNMIATVFCQVIGLYALNNVFVYVNGFIADPSLISVGTVIPVVFHVLFLLAALLVGTAMIPVNLYFENDVNSWLMDTWYLIGHAPLQVLASAIALWFPVVLIVWFPIWGFYALLIFIAVYYAVIAVVITALLKKPLIKILQRKRAEEEA